MRSVERSAVVCYTTRQMYDLVNAVEDYPEFLPWCASAVVHTRSETELQATIVMAMGGLRHSLSTRNIMQPGASIALALVEGPFSDFGGLWRFTPTADNGCSVSLRMDFEFASRLLGVTLGKIFDRAANSMVGSFCKHADRCYGRN